MPRRGTVLALVVAGVLSIAQIGALGATAVFVGSNTQAIRDAISASSFEPGADVAGLADRSGMTVRGRALFYASHASIEPTSGFNAACGFDASDQIVLGCYDGSTIRISDVENPELDGIREVTAAHEMLHAAWARMSAGEQERIGALLEAAYAALPDDGDLASRLELYRTEGLGERVNELHSILGTELADLDPELEEHYAQYLGDRAAVVALSAGYEAVFTQLDESITALVSELDALSTSITTERDAVIAGYDELNADIEDFNVRAENGSITTQSAFDAERSGLLGRGDALDARADAVQSEITRYEGLQEQLAALNSNAAALNRSLDSTLGGPGSLDDLG